MAYAETTCDQCDYTDTLRPGLHCPRCYDGTMTRPDQ